MLLRAGQGASFAGAMRLMQQTRYTPFAFLGDDADTRAPDIRAPEQYEKHGWWMGRPVTFLNGAISTIHRRLPLHLFLGCQRDVVEGGKRLAP